jgi:hypothetical protein
MLKIIYSGGNYGVGVFKRWIMQKYWTIDPQHKWYFKESEGKELYWHSTRKYEQHLIRTRNPYIDFE